MDTRRQWVRIWSFSLLWSLALPGLLAASDKMVVADRAASGYLAEHSLPALALAVGLGSDWIQMDLQATADNKIVVFPDLTLEPRTDVAERFPNRRREDGKFYLLDFTLAELQELRLQSLSPPASPEAGGRVSTTGRHLRLRIPTLAEELELIRGLEKGLGRRIGIAPEIKQPWYYRREGRDISSEVLKVLQEFAYRTKEERVLLQCYDPEELKRIKTTLLPAMAMDLNLLQLIGDNDGAETKVEEWGKWVGYNYDWLFTRTGVKAVSSYAVGIGLDLGKLAGKNRTILLPDLAPMVHELGLVLHLRKLTQDQGMAPALGLPMDQALEFLYGTVGADALGTDSPGTAVAFLAEKKRNTPAAEPGALVGQGVEEKGGVPAQEQGKSEAASPSTPGQSGGSPTTAPATGPALNKEEVPLPGTRAATIAPATLPVTPSATVGPEAVHSVPPQPGPLTSGGAGPVAGRPEAATTPGAPDPGNPGPLTPQPGPLTSGARKPGSD